MKRLIIYFAGVGDLIMLIPLFRELSKDGDLDLLTRGYGAALLRNQSFIRHAYTLSHPNRGRSGLASLVLGQHRTRLGHELQSRHYDEVIILAQERRVIVEWVNGWIGAGRMRTMQYPEQDPDRLAKGFTSLDIPRSSASACPALDVGEEDLGRARRQLAALGQRVVSVQTGAGHVAWWSRKKKDLRQLTPQQWSGFLVRILSDDGGVVLALHGRADQGVAVQKIIRQLPVELRARAHDLTGQVDLHQLKAFLAGSYALLSMNSGPAHMAAAVGCPLLVFYGPANPDAYAMQGRAPVESVIGSAPCQYCMGTPAYRTCRDSICLNTIAVDEMFAAWRRLVDKIESSLL